MCLCRVVGWVWVRGVGCGKLKQPWRATSTWVVGHASWPAPPSDTDTQADTERKGKVKKCENALGGLASLCLAAGWCLDVPATVKIVVALLILLRLRLTIMMSPASRPVPLALVARANLCRSLVGVGG